MNDPRMAQLRWRCRRGMKELDLLLLAFIDSRYESEAREVQQAFKRLLSMPDPDILALLTGKSATDDEHLGYVIQRLLERGET